MATFVLINGEILAISASAIKRISTDVNNNVIIEFSDGEKKTYPFETVEDQLAEFQSFADTLGAIDINKPAVCGCAPSVSAVTTFKIFLFGINFDPTATIVIRNSVTGVTLSLLTFVNPNLLIADGTFPISGIYDVVYSDSNISPSEIILKNAIVVS